MAIALFLLLFIASINYMQIKNLQKSAELVSHSFMIDKEINNLFSQYSLMESAEFRSVILKDSSFADSYIDYKLESDRAFERLSELTKDIPDYRDNLDSVEELKDILHSNLSALYGKIGLPESDSTVLTHVNQTAQLLKELRGLNSKMILKKDFLLEERLSEYKKQTNITPITSLMLAFFSLGIFTVTFMKILSDKYHIQSSETLLQNIVQSTDNIMNYYEPIYDNNIGIVDFKIIFANECNRDYLGLDPEKIMGQPISKVFPFLLINGELEEMIKAFKQNETLDLLRQVALNGEKFWFHSIIKPMKNGILVVVRNKTEENKAHEKVMVLNEQLTVQNKELIRTEAFLASVLDSTNNIIMSFEPLVDDSGYITDFKYLYINERILEITGDIPFDIVGEKVSVANPSVFESGVFNNMVECFVKNRTVEYESSFEFKGKLSWFHATAMRAGNNVTVTANNISKEKNALLELKNLNEHLEIQNSIMLEAKRMAKIGSYIWHMKSGNTEISDNFYRLLGYEPKEFECSMEKYRTFVHSDDLEQYDQIGQLAMENKDSSEHTYRVITKDGAIKYFKSKGKFMEREGHTVMIGVVQDVSDEIKAADNLRINNSKLIRSNIELESFSRVASHDLQEPLRKIQIFISRFDEEEKKKLSEKGKGYFEKIDNAAARMQSLIRNLLTYSQIDSSHEDFEKVDLNLVLEKALEDFSEYISDTKAKINIEKLPIIKGVSFQIKQLFDNLIANSLKYRNPKLDPQIQLKSERVDYKQIPGEFLKPYSYYYKITYTDNGIGFAEEYTDKIFEVFQRLHQKNEYSGTGIGLAICKKIVENHQGHIYATSELGKGSTFIIYLPL